MRAVNAGYRTPSPSVSPAPSSAPPSSGDLDRPLSEVIARHDAHSARNEASSAASTEMPSGAELMDAHFRSQAPALRLPGIVKRQQQLWDSATQGGNRKGRTPKASTPTSSRRGAPSTAGRGGSQRGMTVGQMLGQIAPRHPAFPAGAVGPAAFRPPPAKLWQGPPRCIRSRDQDAENVDRPRSSGASPLARPLRFRTQPSAKGKGAKVESPGARIGGKSGKIGVKQTGKSGKSSPGGKVSRRPVVLTPRNREHSSRSGIPSSSDNPAPSTIASSPRGRTTQPKSQVPARSKGWDHREWTWSYAHGWMRVHEGKAIPPPAPGAPRQVVIAISDDDSENELLVPAAAARPRRDAVPAQSTQRRDPMSSQPAQTAATVVRHRSRPRSRSRAGRSQLPVGSNLEDRIQEAKAEQSRADRARDQAHAKWKELSELSRLAASRVHTLKRERRE